MQLLTRRYGPPNAAASVKALLLVSNPTSILKITGNIAKSIIQFSYHFHFQLLTFNIKL